MSYGIIRIQKFKKNDVRGIQSHDNRERKSHSNPDIDPTKSELNFSLIKCQNQNFSDSINKNLEGINLTKAVRKDAVVMVQCLVTSDHDFFKNIPEPDKQRKFFEQSLAFIADRYGRENIISATVHLDEKTPHMHVNFTPIKNQKLSAKSIFNRTEFRNLHSDFYHSVGQKWGLERGESREEKRRHLDTAAFKIETSRVELEQAKQAEKEQQERVRLYQAQADKADEEIQKDLEIPQGILNRKAALAKALEQLELYKKALADKHIIEAENERLRSKVERLTAQNHILESKNKKNEIALRNEIKGFNNVHAKMDEMRNFIQWDPDVKKAFNAWLDEKAAREKARRLESLSPPSAPKRSFEDDMREEIRGFELEAQKRRNEANRKIHEYAEELMRAKKQEKLQKEKPAEVEKSPLAAPDLGLDKERRRVDQVFSEALRNTSGTAWDHMQQAKKLMEQWEKSPDRETFERQTVNQLQELPKQNDRGR